MGDQEIWAYLPTARLFWNMSKEELELTQRHPVTPSFAEIARHTQELKSSTPVEEAGAEDEAAILKLAIRIANIEGFPPVTTAQEVVEFVDPRAPVEPSGPAWRKPLVVAALVGLALAIATGLAIAGRLPMPIQDLIDRVDLPLGLPGEARADRASIEEASVFPKLEPAASTETHAQSEADTGRASPPSPSPSRSDRARDPLSGEEQARRARERRFEERRLRERSDRRLREGSGRNRARGQPNGSHGSTWRFPPKPRARYSSRAERT